MRLDELEHSKLVSPSDGGDGVEDFAAVAPPATGIGCHLLSHKRFRSPCHHFPDDRPAVFHCLSWIALTRWRIHVGNPSLDHPPRCFAESIAEEFAAEDAGNGALGLVHLQAKSATLRRASGSLDDHIPVNNVGVQIGPATAVSIDASSPRSVALAQLRLTSLAATSLRWDLHPQECAHAGRTCKKALQTEGLRFESS